MRTTKQSQSIIISGESGAGKTESAKYVLQYLTESYGAHSGQIEDRINKSNPLLEAFGNAKTTRNNNSSRFGKFIEVHFNEKYRVVGGYISHYLLEKSRICVQSKDERNYHIFYRLCAGAPENIRSALRLGSPDNFHYLNRGCTQYFCGTQTEKNLSKNRLSQDFMSKGPLRDPQLDDVKDFLECDQSMDHMGLSAQDKINIYSTVATVLHLGNINFEDDPESTKGGCRVASGHEQSLTITSEMLGLNVRELCDGLVTRVIMTKTTSNTKDNLISVPLKAHEAQNARDALAKAVYIRLFDYIVSVVNKSIPFSSSISYIGILDIAGFEYFPINSFEQFCINYCNEKLQQFFNERILKEEQILYEKEGLGLKKIHYIDNQDCIDLIEARITGCFDLLDEESKLPTPRPEHFTSEVHNRNKGHPRLDLPRKSKLRTSREIRDDEGFLIQHFAGSVVYSTAQFIEKNNDALHASLFLLVQECKNSFIKNLFPKASEQEPSTGKLNFISVGSKFRSQLTELMNKLRSTGISFIRCIKPNLKMIPNLFEGGQILSQLQCSGMVSVLDLMQQGFPSRTQFAELYAMYKSYLPAELARLEPRLFCKCLFKALNLRDADFKFGLTKVFFRPGKFAEFDELMKSDPQNLAGLISKVKKWLLWTRWKTAQWCALSVIKLKNKILYRRQCYMDIQRHIRMHLVYRRYAPRIRGLVKAKALHEQVASMENIAQRMKSNKEQVYQQIHQLKQRIDQLINNITNTQMTATQIDDAYNDLVSSIDREFRRLNQTLAEQEMKEEAERLKKIQKELENEKSKKFNEDKQFEKEQEEFRQRSVLAQRQREEEQLKTKVTAEEARRFKERQAQESAEEAYLAEMNERERRDYELARRLALEMGSEADLPRLARTRRPATNQKYDLNKHTYAQLRDLINTSCDIELLDACREEFHRRLKVYHAWKLKNRKTKNQSAVTDENDIVDDERAPKDILNNVVSTPLTDGANRTNGQNTTSAANNSSKGGNKTGEQRYFRVPFVRPNEQNRDASSEHKKKGWWYAHFDDKWIVRQMEIHQDRKATLLVSGVDDTNMCELSLDETGLTGKKGAEILENDFEQEWAKHGGRECNCRRERNYTTMAGMKFEYDESGGKFYYFILSVYGLILVPATYWLWPKVEKRKSTPHPEERSNFTPCRDKHQLLHANEPNQRRRAMITKIGLIVAWIVLIFLAYRVSLIETEHKEYDPFAVLNIDREASTADIKRAYRDLSKKHHPDRGGDPEMFKEIAKAYKTLTDEEAKENWKKYGNPDGPGVTHFGIALPKWLVDHKNSVFVLLVYAGIFMIVLPVIVCLWWQKSARYSGDQILIDTIQLYWIFLSKTSSIIVKRAIMILSASREFDRTRNPLIVDRLSDNVELPKLFRELPDIQEKTKERPFQMPYCLKARTLLHAHLQRLTSLSPELENDKRYVVKKSPYLINEMINIEAQLVAMGHAGRLKNPPRLDTIENTMRLSPMIVQALWNTKSPLLQLPHITESQLRFFETKKRTIKSVRQFAAMDGEERRSMLRSITDEQYDDIMNVLAIYPHITMSISCGVFDDEDEHIITTGAVVTLTIHLQRENMSNVFNKELGLNQSSKINAMDEEANEEQVDDKENREKTNDTPKATAASSTSKGWNNKADKKKKSKKKGQTAPSKANNTSANKQSTPANANKKQEKVDEKDSSDDDSSKHSDDSPSTLRHRHHEQSKDETNNSDNENNDEDNPPATPKKSRTNADNDEDTFLERFQQQQRKREKLETKAKISHRVFCPFYPEVKQECWWLYVADHKEEVEVKFSAPKTPGHYVYSVILRSDSYFDVDVMENLAFDVQAAKEMDNNHPQWDFSEDEGAANAKAEDEEFATESESDDE
ncbi:unnamed protein product [Adineta ricciae]|uniref:Uncharacterized protein n=1 Tax=Adineta ricciae TaxID=249248 RepID=A0A813MLV0_ADIRI|nr:unnamed protein product [Adineta ricciae]